MTNGDQADSHQASGNQASGNQSSAGRPRLVHVGNVLVDVVLYLPALPEPGGDVLASASAITPGGGLNVLVAATRQGLPSVYGGRIGTGPFGDLCRAALTEAGIHAPQPAVADQDTGFTVALVDPTGERTFATSPGAEAQLTIEHLAALTVRPTDVVYVSGYGLAYPVNGPAITAWLSTVDATVIVDPGPLIKNIKTPILDAVLDRADWWSCNEREARLLGRAEGRVGTVVRTGGNGCVLHTSNEPCRRFRSPPWTPTGPATPTWVCSRPVWPPGWTR
ncbi:MAG TPA: PfkB family carbohydrate kinase [Pseudonocardiaceae bacterium]|nr:PfkB family carbohydrate kinase [Pseudonocardiaceae bacterium]